jgi:transcriptional regulator of acetoin/glycerol metabolism
VARESGGYNVPARPQTRQSEASDSSGQSWHSAASDERTLLFDALERANGNKAEAARLLDMPRSTFYSKLKKYTD